MSANDRGAAKPSYFSMLRLSGIHIPNCHRVHMAFQAYYDGSGKEDRPCTTLTGVAASEELWPDFECRWIAALDQNEVPDRDFHMTDLMSSNGRFKGWDETKQNKLLTDLFNVLGHFAGRGLTVYSCTVIYDAYRTANRHIPALRRPEAMCVDFCVGGLRLTQEQLRSEPRPILLYFDRNETFLRHVDRVWRRGQKKKTGWPWQVRNIIQADRSEYYPIQAADMIGWIVTRCRSDAATTGVSQPEPTLAFSDQIDKHQRLFHSTWLMVNHHMKWYDNARQIIDRYPNG